MSDSADFPDKENKIDWPPLYSAKFSPEKGLAIRVALLATPLSLFRLWKNFLVSVGSICIGAALPFAIERYFHLQGWWQVLSLTPALVLLGGAIFGIFANENIRKLYEPGSIAHVMVGKGNFVVELNGRVFGNKLTQIVRVEKYGSLSVVRYRDHKMTILPTRYIPHFVDQNSVEYRNGVHSEPALNKREHGE